MRLLPYDGSSSGSNRAPAFPARALAGSAPALAIAADDERASPLGFSRRRLGDDERASVPPTDRSHRNARKRNARVIAEGIERLDQLRALAKLGCEYGQDYHFARPLPQAEIEALIR
jgi:hypothetical protein